MSRCVQIATYKICSVRMGEGASGDLTSAPAQPAPKTDNGSSGGSGSGGEKGTGGKGEGVGRGKEQVTWEYQRLQSWRLWLHRALNF